MKRINGTNRYIATDELRRQIESQGRRSDWLAQHVGFSKGFLSKVVSGNKTISEEDARVLAALLHIDFRVLFEVPESATLALFGEVA